MRVDVAQSVLTVVAGMAVYIIFNAGAEGSNPGQTNLKASTGGGGF
jgi:hypothetical protein